MPGKGSGRRRAVQPIRSSPATENSGLHAWCVALVKLNWPKISKPQYCTKTNKFVQLLRGSSILCFMFLSIGHFLSDVVYCPRLTCGVAVIQEKSGKAAMCSVCGFAFCVTCRKTYHGTESCQFQKSILENIPEQGCAELPTSEGKQTYMCSKKNAASVNLVTEKSPMLWFCFFVA